jgi:undecaprenyl-diphosphatase
MSVWQAIILAFVEGLTEFLPVSSTGHMIIAASLMGISELEFTKLFNVNIQFGAIISVVVLYYRRFVQSIDLYLRLFVAILPAAVIGYVLIDVIDLLLGSVMVVAIMLVVGGIVLVYIDTWLGKVERPEQPLTYKQAFTVGLFQCIAMIPGISRSAATIIGGLVQGVNRKTAAEFSFFLAIPTMAAAGGYKLYESYETIRSEDIHILLIGNGVAFLVGILAIRFFIAFVTKYGFRWFGYYRIFVGITILVLVLLGYDLQIKIFDC